MKKVEEVQPVVESEFVGNQENKNLYATRKLSRKALIQLAQDLDTKFKNKEDATRGYVVPRNALPADRVLRVVGVRPGRFNIEAHPFKYGEASVAFNFSGFHGGIPQFEKETGIELKTYGHPFKGYGARYV